jgi:hypothetical protein
MEIHALKLVVTETDLNQLARTSLPAKSPVRELRVRVEEGRLRISGDYQALVVPVPFETMWELSVQKQRACVELVDVRVIGLPAGVLRGFILSSLGKLATRESGIRLENDLLVIDVDGLLQQYGVLLRTNLKTIRCEPGQVILEA